MAGPRRLPRKCWRAAPPQRPHRRDLTDSSLRAAAFPSECSGTDALPLQRSGASPCTTTEPSYHEAMTQGSSPPASLTVSATPPPSIPPDSASSSAMAPRRPPHQLWLLSTQNPHTENEAGRCPPRSVAERHSCTWATEARTRTVTAALFTEAKPGDNANAPLWDSG